ncbi:H(+) Cl(-) exchange transporter 5 isoform X2 [Paramuricea clavata]|uniref:Chloride channel protein n=1 Tax=Paramuricea clavata TaxID=317549 RepID=A0A6S7IUI5_PARCT|nr:H(+) Cl(-) exchange transporter 5 isoform X2 [Paramuricea clavata]
MAVGACIGRITGIGMEQLVLNHPDFPIFEISCRNTVGACVQPGLYAMVGAAAALGGVTRMTVSLVVIMFELTGGLFYIVPMMLAVVMSKWIGDAFGKGGIYDSHIELNMYPFLDNKEEFAYTSLAEDVAKPRKFEPSISCVTKDSSTIEQLEILLEETSFKGFPVVDDMECMRLYGYVRRKELRIALETARAKNHDVVSLSIGYFTKHAPRTEISHPPLVSLRHTLDESPLQVTHTTPMEAVVEMFRKLGLRQVLVTRDGRVTGIITKKDVIKHVQIMDKKTPDAVRYGTL